MKLYLEWLGSNQRIFVSKTNALPLGYIPLTSEQYDSNIRSSEPKSDTLPDYAMLRKIVMLLEK